jgi:hypothetical protein
VVTAIRFLAKPNCSVNREIGLLLAALRETRILRAIFTEAQLSDHISPKNRIKAANLAEYGN